MEIKIIETLSPDKELLFLADESPDLIDDYVARGRCFAAYSGDEVVGQYVLLLTRPRTAEIVNIAVRPCFQRQGVATKMLAHAAQTAVAKGMHTLEIGTGNSSLGQIALYQQCGFVQCGVDVDYFRLHYPAPIFENGIECRDMVRLRMEL